jgi:cyclopropane-fatty-acyl-phospholipid synthase
MSWDIDLMERGLLPDAVVRHGIRRLLKKRIDEINSPAGLQAEAAFIASLSEAPVAVQTDKANEQHYEVPTSFFQLVLGPHMKYSSCIWPETVKTLAEAEEAMLALTCERAGLADGMQILELGCGWGSLSLWMAEHYPKARITAVSNSHSQRTFIQEQARTKSLNNLNVITADMNEFDGATGPYDRVVSVEMFEHMRNYHTLLERIASWLKPDGKLFVHIFCHKERTYPFETTGEDDWMGKYFFTGGLMPAEKLLNTFDAHLRMEQQWAVSGIDYARTLRAWLDLMDAKRDQVMPILTQVYGAAEGGRWFHRWRVFFMACEELFAYHEGNEWFVTHLLLARS